MAKAKKSAGKSTKTLLIAGGIVLLLVLIIALWIGSTYNGLVQWRENTNGKWAQVETQYQRRADLIPNLVEVVGAYAKQERTVLESVTAQRAKVGSIQLNADDLEDPAKLQAFQEAQDDFGSAISRLLVVAEAYPDLKSNQNFLALQDQLEGTENRIAVARKDYNDAVQQYNIYVQRFPSNIVAGMFNFDIRAFFEAAEGAENAPQIEKGDLVQ